ncbi:MAG TPA: pyrimidine reductase family protein [Actinoplanes sp.]|nr:pyrimidine reductase family protein [Actinoplanes sp.]
MTAGEVTRLWPKPDVTPMEHDAIAQCYPRTEGPTLRVNFVSSIDGAVSIDGYSEPLSSPGDKLVFGTLRMVCDALVVGAGTVRTEGYRALRLDERRRAWRTQRGLSPYPVMVVVSGSLDLDPAQPVFADAPVRPIIVTHSLAPADRRAALGEVADVLAFGTGAIDLTAMVHELHERGATQLLSEGGPRLFGTLTAADLVDEVCLTVSPLLAGAGAGRITTGPPAVPRTMSLRHALSADGALLLRYARS